MKLILLTSFLFLTACTQSGKIQISSGLCDGLQRSIDNHAEEILDHSTDTHPDVIESGTEVIKGFDEGCKDG